MPSSSATLPGSTTIVEAPNVPLRLRWKPVSVTVRSPRSGTVAVTSLVTSKTCVGASGPKESVTSVSVNSIASAMAPLSVPAWIVTLPSLSTLASTSVAVAAPSGTTPGAAGSGSSTIVSACNSAVMSLAPVATLASRVTSSVTPSRYTSAGLAPNVWSSRVTCAVAWSAAPLNVAWTRSRPQAAGRRGSRGRRRRTRP